MISGIHQRSFNGYSAPAFVHSPNHTRSLVVVLLPFDGLEGLRSPHKCLHVVGFYLENRGSVLHGGVKVR